MLGVHPNTVNKLVKAGKLRGINIGTKTQKHYRVSEEDFAVFVAEAASKPFQGVGNDRNL